MKNHLEEIGQDILLRLENLAMYNDDVTLGTGKLIDTIDPKDSFLNVDLFLSIIQNFQDFSFSEHLSKNHIELVPDSQGQIKPVQKSDPFLLETSVTTEAAKMEEIEKDPEQIKSEAVHQHEAAVLSDEDKVAAVAKDRFPNSASPKTPLMPDGDIEWNEPVADENIEAAQMESRQGERTSKRTNRSPKGEKVKNRSKPSTGTDHGIVHEVSHAATSIDNEEKSSERVASFEELAQLFLPDSPGTGQLNNEEPEKDKGKADTQLSNSNLLEGGLQNGRLASVADEIKRTSDDNLLPDGFELTPESQIVSETTESGTLKTTDEIKPGLINPDESSDELSRLLMDLLSGVSGEDLKEVLKEVVAYNTGKEKRLRKTGIDAQRLDEEKTASTLDIGISQDLIPDIPSNYVKDKLTEYEGSPDQGVEEPVIDFVRLPVPEPELELTSPFQKKDLRLTHKRYYGR